MSMDNAIISTGIMKPLAGAPSFSVTAMEGSTGILLSTLWSQDGIFDIGDNTTITYNEYCPTDPNTQESSLTGCTNTAAGQIIYYFVEKKGLALTLTLENSDEYTSDYYGLVIQIKADGSTPGTLSFAAVNDYLSGFELDSAEHGAALLYACGVIQQADYSSEGTSTGWIPNLFIRAGLTSADIARSYWGNCYWSLQIGYGQYNFTDEGFEVLIENLEAGRPVGASIPGHAVVIDGYDWDEDKFHVNYGWGKYTEETRWYTRQEMQDLNFNEFVYDLRTDHQQVFTVTDSRVYGTGTMIRAIEQANAMTGDNTVEFSSAVENQALELTGRINLSADIEIDHFNMLVSITDSSSSWGLGFYSSAECSVLFNDFSGALIVDTAYSTNTAFYLGSCSDSAVYADHSLIYGGSYAQGSDHSAGAGAVLAALQSAQENLTEPGNEILDSASYCFSGSTGSDIFSLDNRSIAVGDVQFLEGSDALILTGHSRLYGRIINTGSEADTITIDSTSSLVGGLSGNAGLTFRLNEVAESAMFTITSSVYNVYYYAEISADMTRAELGTYTLFAAGSGAAYANYLNWFTVTVTGTGEGDIVLSGTGTATSDYADLIIEDNALKLQIKKQSSITEKTSGDLNADGRADIVMTIAQGGHPADGSTGAWLIQNDQTAEWGDLSTRNPGWEIFGTGRTAAGKKTDDVYIRSTDNVIGAWTTDNDGKVNGWETIGEFGADTQIVGLGDFNGNGQTDLLLRNTNGAVGCFFTGGETTGWNYFQSLGDEWKLSAIGDLNGDGRDDVVLKHDAGFAGSWLTQADGTMAWADLDTLPEGFAIIGAGDFNGDGTDDVLLKNGSYYGAWLVNNGNAAGWMGLGDLGDVTVEQIADFNGDGKDDLRIRTAGGDLGAQLVMGEDDLSWKYYGSVGSEWSTALAALA